MPSVQVGNAIVTDDGRWSLTNVSLHWLIQTAYGLRPFGEDRIIGGEPWIHSARFDVVIVLPKEGYVASSPRNRRMEIRKAMLQDMLRDQFQLILHGEKREVPVWLVKQSPGGVILAPGDRLEQACLPDGRNGCHIFTGGIGRGIHSGAATITDAADYVSNWSDRPLIDKTGLAGLYKFETQGWVPVDGPVRHEGMDDVNRLSIFELFARMGLRLEASVEPLETITIESARRPLSN